MAAGGRLRGGFNQMDGADGIQRAGDGGGEAQAQIVRAGACRQRAFQCELFAERVALGQRDAREQLAFATQAHFEFAAGCLGRVLLHLGLLVRQAEVARQACGVHLDRAHTIQPRLRIQAAGMEQVHVVDRRVGARQVRQQRQAQAQRPLLDTVAQTLGVAAQQRGTVKGAAAWGGQCNAIVGEGCGLDGGGQLNRERRRVARCIRRGVAAIHGVVQAAGAALVAKRYLGRATGQYRVDVAVQIDVGGKRAIAVIDAQRLITLQLRRHPRQEILPVARGHRRPRHFGYRCQAREQRVVDVPARGNVFGPQRALRAEHMPGLLGIERGRHRVERVDLRERQRGQAAVGFIAARGLQVVQIQRIARCQHHVVALLGGGHRAFDATPGHHGRAGRHAAFEDFVPADHAPAMLGEVLGQLFVEPALHRVCVLDAELAHLCANGRRGFPLVLDCLIAADVDVGRREQREHFIQHIGDEGQAAFAGVEQVRVDAPVHTHLGAHTGDAHLFGVGGNGRLRMPGHIQLGQHGDVQARRVGHHFADLFLRVEAAIALRCAVLARARRRAPRTHLGELGVALDLDPPALVIGEMPVQHVELVHGHRVEHMLDRCHVVEVARHIQMLAAPAETRPVADGHRRYLDIALACIRGHQLPCAHGAVEQPGAITRLDAEALRVAIQAIAFLLRYRCLRAAFQADAAR